MISLPPSLGYFSEMLDAVSWSTVSQKIPHAWTAVEKENLCDLHILVGGRLLRWHKIGRAAAFCLGAVVFVPGQCPFWSDKSFSLAHCPLFALPNETSQFFGHSWVLAEHQDWTLFTGSHMRRSGSQFLGIGGPGLFLGALGWVWEDFPALWSCGKGSRGLSTLKGLCLKSHSGIGVFPIEWSVCQKALTHFNLGSGGFLTCHRIWTKLWGKRVQSLMKIYIRNIFWHVLLPAVFFLRKSVLNNNSEGGDSLK